MGEFGDDIISALRDNPLLEGQVQALQSKCAVLEEARSQAVKARLRAEEAGRLVEEAKKAAEARSEAADEGLAVAVSMKKTAETERGMAVKAKEVAEAEVEKMKRAFESREGTWPAEKKRIALVLGASNRMAQKALAKNFPEVAGQFDIEKEGMEGARMALTSVKPGAREIGTSKSGTTPQKA